MSLRRQLLLCSAALVLFTADPHAQQPSLGSLAPSWARADASKTSAPTEQAWIVADIVTAIDQMVAFAQDGSITRTRATASPAQSGAFSITRSSGARMTLPIPGHVWDAPAYAAIAAPIANTKGCGAEKGANLIDTLVDPRPAVLVAASAQVSKRLQQSMGCPDAHHEAALLLGTLGLREAAGGFSDTRRILSRMTAHLAVAHAIAPQSRTTTSDLAHAVLRTLIGQQRAALDTVHALGASNPGPQLQPWILSLRLRNTFDWRLAPIHTHVTLLEQLAILRALDVSVGNGAALDRFGDIGEPAQITDWARLILHERPGVEEGNRFTEYWMAAELVEFAEVVDAMGVTPAPADRAGVMNLLNTEPADGPVGADAIVRVIDTGTWAAASQRHLMMSLVAHHRHLANMLGLTGDARAFRDEVSRTYSALTLYPIAAMGLGYARDEIASERGRAAGLAETRPELITDHNWRTMQRMLRWAVIKPAREASTWFQPLLVTGTAYDIEHRSQPIGDTPRLAQAQVGELRRVAPYSRALAKESVRWGGSASFETLKKEYASLSAYDLELAKAVAKSVWNQPELYVAHMQRVCEMHPDVGYAELAPYLVDHSRIDEGRRAYEAWLDKGRREVWLSTATGWLVRHYHERGEHAKATEVADRSAETGSFWGLVTRANLHDWRGEFEDAETLHRRAWKRYDNPNELLAFYLRNGRKDAEVQKLIGEVFPAGVSHVADTPPTTAPRNGLVVLETGITGAAEGLKVDDVVVAVDGYRIQNLSQYRVVRGSSHDAAMKLTVWRNGSYVTVTPKLRYRWIVNMVDTYKPRASSRE